MGFDTSESNERAPQRNESLEQVAGFIDQVIHLMQQGGINELKLQHGDFRLKLQSDGVPPGSTSSSGHAAPSTGTSQTSHVEESDDTYTITAPMIGTYYAAPAPGEPPFVQAGDVLEDGQTVGIIEAMKIMNEIASDVAGEVVEIVAENGQTVEYGSPLVVVRPSS